MPILPYISCMRLSRGMREREQLPVGGALDAGREGQDVADGDLAGLESLHFGVEFGRAAYEEHLRFGGELVHLRVEVVDRVAGRRVAPRCPSRRLGTRRRSAG